MINLIVGAGEVGKALHEVLGEYHECYIRDINNTLQITHADVLHVCFPCSPDNPEAFYLNVKQYQQLYAPQLTIVHSTVPVGMCDRLNAVSSPVRGRHPNLAPGIRTFEKFFGGPQAQEAADIFIACGIKVAIRKDARSVEAGKLWELAQYGLAIFIEKHIYTWCAQKGLDFDTVYTDFALTYNAGYKELGEAQFIRPILTHMPGPIGGHCVVPGSQMIGDVLADFVTEAGREPVPTEV